MNSNGSIRRSLCRRFGLGGLGNAKEHNRSIRTAYATRREAAGGLQLVQLLAEAAMELKLEVLTDSTANFVMHNRIGSGRVRHLDVKWLWIQEAVQAGRFSLKKVSTDSNVSDLTTKHHDEQSRNVLMTPGRLRYTRGRGDAVATASEGQTIAVMNAV